MFIDRQQQYFEYPNFVPAADIRWTQVMDHFYAHDNFDPRVFFGDPSDARKIMQSPQMLDCVFGDRHSVSR